MEAGTSGIESELENIDNSVSYFISVLAFKKYKPFLGSYS